MKVTEVDVSIKRKRSRRRELNTGPVVTDEKEVVTKMIAIYCKRKHKQKELCEECETLEAFAHKRLSLCPFGEKKGACSNCPVHCYLPEYKEKIKVVMRYSGKWMILYHPIYSVKHLVATHRE